MTKKQKQRSNQVSKGQRNSVSRKLINRLASERRENPFKYNFKGILESKEFRESVMMRVKDRSLKELRDKFIKYETIMLRATELFARYKDSGATWAGCVHSVKTNFTQQFEQKWGLIKADKGQKSTK